jgi:hypothetical protein
MLASIPASILNHIRAGSGIPFDSEKISHALGGKFRPKTEAEIAEEAKGGT